MIKKAVLCCLCFSSAVVASSEEFSPNYSLGISIENGNAMLLPQGAKLTQDFIPKFSLRAALDKQLNDDWLLSSGVSIDFSRSEFSLTSGDDVFLSDVENTGIWLDSTFIYQSMHQDIKPFVQFSAGKIYGSYQVNGTNQSDWETGYKVTTGLQFNLNNGHSISIGIGKSNIDPIN